MNLNDLLGREWSFGFTPFFSPFLRSEIFWFCFKVSWHGGSVNTVSKLRGEGSWEFFIYFFCLQNASMAVVVKCLDEGKSVETDWRNSN